MVHSTKGSVTATEDSYSNSDDCCGFSKPNPLIRTGRDNKSRSFPTYFSRDGLEPRAVPRCLWPSDVTLTKVFAKTSIPTSSLLGLVINQDFFAFGKYPYVGPFTEKSSNHFLISSNKPHPVTSFANQHCSVALDSCLLVISGWRLMAYRLIASGSPWLVPSTERSSFPQGQNDWQALFKCWLHTLPGLDISLGCCEVLQIC